MHKNVKDITGRKFNNWKVIERAKSKKGQALWRCVCVCGQERIISGYKLRNGKIKGCRRCCKVIDLTGQKINKWLVLERDFSKNKNVCWICRCDCGNVKSVFGCHLTRNKTVCCRKCSEHKNKERINTRIWSRIKYSAKKRNLEFNLGETSEAKKYLYDLFLEQEGKCALSGVPIYFANTIEDDKHGVTTASLDRIDSGKGYIRDNIQWVHKDVNLMKLDHPVDEFLNWCNLVVSYNKVE